MAKNGRKIAAGVGAVSTLAVSGAALANSQTVGASSTPSSRPSSSTQAQQGNDAHGPRGMRGLDDKAVTGTAATNVKNAVKAKDASITSRACVRRRTVRTARSARRPASASWSR